VNRLKGVNKVEMGPAVNTPNTGAKTALATVNGQPITASDLEERLKPFAYKLKMTVFEAQMRAVNIKVNDILLTAEAKKRGVTPEEFTKTEIISKITPPTDSEVTKFYTENKDRIKGDLATLKTDIANFLQQQQANKLESDLAQRLRSGASIQVFLQAPEPPVQNVSADDDPSRGSANAPVTMVVFTDFQCPYCATTHPIVEEIERSYGDRVRLVVRDFPLPQHEFAVKAAEAANAANAQGKFFEYAGLLFKNQSALDAASLKKYATQLGLDRAKFDADLDSGKYAAEVRKDVADGQFYGIESTPAVFINGVKIPDITAIGIRAAIDRSLAKSGTRTASVTK
jgi:protein-disulfide isomerase